MRVAIPLRGEVFCEHFGQSDAVWLCDVEASNGDPTCARIIPRPAHRPVGGCESFPMWLHSLGVTNLLAGGIGQVAVHRLGELGIAVSSGQRNDAPLEMVKRFLANPDAQGPNSCNEGHQHDHHHCTHE